jgi:hypothetical protein
MNTIKVFCLDACEHSNHLKQELWDNNITFEELYLGSTQAIHDLLSGGLHHARAPVLQVKERFYTGNVLFPGGVIDRSFIDKCLSEADTLVTSEKNNQY